MPVDGFSYTGYQPGWHAGIFSLPAGRRHGERPGSLNSAATGCANQGLDVTADLNGTAHFGGPPTRTPSQASTT